MLTLKDPSLFKQQAYLNGLWCDADSAERIAVTNPATGATLGYVPNMGAAETQRAISAASTAFKAWRSKLAKERSTILRKWHELMLANADDLAAIMTAEQGKPFSESKGEISYAASFLEWFAEEAKRIYGETMPTPTVGRRIMVTKEPIGVCAAITPWNFPAAMITRKAGPALAAGCPMVLKPASQTPFSALALAELAHRAGVPPGIFSVVTGNASTIGGEMTSNPIVRKVTFTGSTQIGKLLMRQSADSLKKLSLELGGNAPFVVFDDADLDTAVDGALASKFRNSGQTCVCANRLYVQDKVHDAFVAKLRVAVQELQVGDGAKPGTTQGPLIDQNAVEKVEEHIADALAKGARVALGGNRHSLGFTFFEPTILTDVTQSMKVASEETFGPLAPIFRFQTDDEVIKMANDTEFGLAAYFFSRDIGRIWRVAEQLEYGIVGINTGIISNEVAPFGGIKQSGFGREGSKYGMDDYLTVKYWCLSGM